MGRTRRVTLREAAKILGVSKEAVRKRVARGTLPSDVGGDGRRYVYLDAVGGDDHHDPHDRGDDRQDPRDELISQLRGEVEAWREESRRKDTIIMNMTEAMRAIAPPVQEEPPQEQPEAPQTATEQPGRVGAQASLEGAQEGSERPWWRRVFGG
jgi:hypothetical protein